MVLTWPGASRADLWSVSGSGSDGPLSASANFTITSGQIQVTITNLLSPTTIRSQGQAVSDLIFTVSNAPGTNTSNSALGSLVDVGTGGSITSVSGSPGRWVGLEKDKHGHALGGFGISGETVTLETIGGGKPSEMILPGTTVGVGYPNANPGGFTKGNFDPYVNGPATFTLNFSSGVTSTTTVTAVSFSFGTGPDTNLTGTHVVPEPSTMAIAGLGALGFLGYSLRRRIAK